MTRYPLKSSAISQVAYDRATRELQVWFHSNPARPYSFYDVPPGTVKRLVEAPSPGRFFHAEIRTRYADQERTREETV